MKVIGLLLLMAPILMNALPQGWENVTLGVVAHLIMDYLNKSYHAEA